MLPLDPEEKEISSNTAGTPNHRGVCRTGSATPEELKEMTEKKMSPDYARMAR